MSKTYNSKKNPNHKPKSKSAYVSVLKNGVISLKKGRRLKCYISKDQVGRNIIVTCFTRSEIRKAVKAFNKHNKGFCASLKEDEELNCFKVTIYQED